MPYIGNRPDAFQYTSTSSQSLSGNGVTTTFTLSRQVSANADIEVVVNNVPQEPGFAYYVSDLTNLNFTSPPSAAANNIYIIYRNYVQSGIAPGANTVTTSAIAANTIQPWQLTNSLLNPIVNTFTANGTGTTYTLSFAPPSANAVVVTVNGITQNFPENYSTNDTVLTFTDPPASNSVIRVLQQAMVGTSIVPIDGSVTTSKLASGLTLSGTTTINTLVSSGATLSGGSINNMTIGGTTANTGAFTTLSTTGVATFSAGSAGAPALTTSGDTNTGMFFPAADTIAFAEGGVESMRIDSSGNLGIGTNSLSAKLTVNGGTGTSQTRFEVNTTEVQEVITNAAQNAYANRLADAAQHIWKLSSSEAMRLNSSGNLGIGTTSPSARLHVAGADEGLRVQRDGGFVSFFNTANSTRSGYLQIQAADVARLNVEANQPLLIFTNSTERMRITSSGLVGIGTNSPNGTVTISTQLNALAGTGNTFGLHLYPAPSGVCYVDALTNSSSNSALALRSYNNGTYYELRLNQNGNLALPGGAGGVTGTGITFPATQSASSDANTLDDYEEGTWTPTLRGSGGTAGSYAQSQSGNYVKIGKLVWIWGNVTISNKGSWTGTVYFSLPFNVDTAFSTGAVRSQLHTFSGNLVCEWSTADAVTARFNVTASGGNQNNLDWSGMSQSVGNFMSFSLVYQATT